MQHGTTDQFLQAQRASLNSMSGTLLLTARTSRWLEHRCVEDRPQASGFNSSLVQMVRFYAADKSRRVIRSAGALAFLGKSKGRLSKLPYLQQHNV